MVWANFDGNDFLSNKSNRDSGATWLRLVPTKKIENNRERRVFKNEGETVAKSAVEVNVQLVVCDDEESGGRVGKKFGGRWGVW